jgi:hypothetical protein
MANPKLLEVPSLTESRPNADGSLTTSPDSLSRLASRWFEEMQ